MIKSNLRTLVILIIGFVVASFYACSKDSQTALSTTDLSSEGAGLDLRGGDTTCIGHPHPPHDSLWVINHQHDSTWIKGHHHLHDSIWIINHPKDTTGIGGGHHGGPKGGGHPGGGHGGHH